MSSDVMPPEASGPIAWMAHNRVAANLLMMFFFVGGLAAFRFIKQEVFPDMQENIVTVSVSYPGASPEEVEQGIVLAVEEALSGQEGVDEIQSTASEGHAVIQATLLEGVDSIKVYQDLKNEVDRITTLPEDSEEPVTTLEQHRRGVMTLALFGEARETSLRQLGEQVRDALLEDPDITQVDLEGVRPLEISIEIPQENLRRYNLTLQQVANILKTKALDLPGGGVKTQGGEILVRVVERRDFGHEFADMPIITGPDGSEVRLRDIAAVIDGFEDTDQYGLYNRKPSVQLEVYRVGDQTPVQVGRAVERRLDMIRPGLPDGIEIAVMHSMASVYQQRVTLLLKNGAIGLVLVLLLLGVFLELRLAFWVMTGIPVSFLGALILMYFWGVSINMMTLFAFIMALGIVVDDAIVVGENVYHHYQEGMPFLRAAVHGAREVGTPVAFSILTNIVAFLPLAVLPGMMGRIMKMLPVVVVCTFVLSWIECLLILPCHLGHHRPRERTGFSKWLHERQQGFSLRFRQWVQTRYGPFLSRCLTHRYFVVMTACALLIVTLSYVASGRMGFEMFPRIESDYAYGSVVLPYGAHIERTRAAVDRMMDASQKVVDDCGCTQLVKGVIANIGRSGSHTADVRIYLADPEIREKIMSTQQFVERWREAIGEIPGIENMKLMSDRGGPGSGSALTVELRHRDVDALEKAAADLARELEHFPRVSDIDDGVQRGKQQMDFRIRPESESLGLHAADVARQIRNAYEGAEVLRQQRGRNEIKVKVRYTENERDSEDDIRNLILRTASGGEVPLEQAVTIQRGRAYTTITHRNGQRTMTVSADVRPRAQAGQVIEALDRETLPALLQRYPGLSYSYEGHQAENRKSGERLSMLIPVTLLAIYALLAVPFRSYIQPLIVMVSIPFGVVGAVAGHLIMGYNMSMMGLIGIVALSGVVINDALILVDFVNRARGNGMPVKQAVVQAGIQRFRPIMLTTLTTFGGLAPMIFETSRQARFMIPMALSLGYGLLFATMITLVLVPSLYMAIEDIRSAFLKKAYPAA